MRRNAPPQLERQPVARSALGPPDWEITPERQSGNGSADSSRRRRAPGPDRRGCRRCARCPTLRRMLPGPTPAASCSCGGHLPMRRRCRMAGQRFRIAQIHQALEQLERVVETHAGLQAAADFESHQRARPAAQIFLHQADDTDCRQTPQSSPTRRADRRAGTRRLCAHSRRDDRCAAPRSRCPAAAERRSSARAPRPWCAG